MNYTHFVDTVKIMLQKSLSDNRVPNVKEIYFSFNVLDPNNEFKVI